MKSCHRRINRFQQTKEAIEKLYVSTQSGEQVPLSTVVKISQEVVPNDLTQFQQLNSVDYRSHTATRAWRPLPMRTLT